MAKAFLYSELTLRCYLDGVLSNKIGVVTGLFAIFVGIEVFMYSNDGWAWGFIPVALMVAVLWQLSEPINDWYLSKNPVKLDAIGTELLERHIPYYRQLNEEQKDRFRSRIYRFISTKEWTPMNLDEVPDDIKVLIAAPAVLLSLHQKKYMYNRYERIILYRGPFISPSYNRHWHHVESEHEDGTVLLNVDVVAQGVFDRPRIYDVALYVWIEVYLKIYSKNTPKLLYLDWDRLKRISGMSKAQIDQNTGLPDIKSSCVTLHHFINFPELFKEIEPEVFKSINTLFRIYHES